MPPAWVALIAQLGELRAYTPKEEMLACERDAEIPGLGEGVFPALLFGGGTGHSVGWGGHRVILIDLRTKRIKVRALFQVGVGEQGGGGGEHCINGTSTPVPPL